MSLFVLVAVQKNIKKTSVGYWVSNITVIEHKKIKPSYWIIIIIVVSAARLVVFQSHSSEK